MPSRRLLAASRHGRDVGAQNRTAPPTVTT
jgi:hypothetical protein